MNKSRSVYITTNETCNLNCVYCYESDKTNKTEFDIDLAINTIEKVLNEPGEFVYINFHGGEPFLVFNKIKALCEHIWNKHYPSNYIFYATSNGTLIHGRIQEWLAYNKNRFVVGLSLDGTKEMHDLNRCQSFDRIDIDFFKNTWPKQGVKMTISPKTVSNLADGVIFLHNIGIYQINANLAEMVDWSDDSLLITYKRELKKLSDYYLCHPDINRCSLFKINFAGIINSTPKKWCGAGTSMEVTDINGKKFPCHLFFESVCGKKKSDLSKEINFHDDSQLFSDICRSCGFLVICPTCLGSNYIARGSISARDMVLCKYTKARIFEVASLEYKQIINSTQSTNNLSKQEVHHRLLTLEGIEKILPFLENNDRS